MPDKNSTTAASSVAVLQNTILTYHDARQGATGHVSRQDAEHGWQLKLDLLDRPASEFMIGTLEELEVASRNRQGQHRHSFLDLLVEELAEVASETDPEEMEIELRQLAALAIGWAQASREKRGAA